MMEAKIITQEKTASFGTNFGIIWRRRRAYRWMDDQNAEEEGERGGNGSLSRCKLGPLGKMGGG